MNYKQVLFVLSFLLFIFNFSNIFAQSQNLSIIYIGDSITYGAGLDSPATQAPPVIASSWLRKQKGVGQVNFYNQGHSGYTTLDFLPGTPAFKQVLEAAKAFGQADALLVFSVMIGTNDSAVKGTHGAPVSVEDYRINLKMITDTLLTHFPKAIIIYQHPLWYSPNTQNGATYLLDGLTRLQTYIPMIDGLATAYKAGNPNHVFVGDTKAFGYFKANYLTHFQAEPGRQGTFYLHPNKKGAIALGEFWAKAIYKVVSK